MNISDLMPAANIKQGVLTNCFTFTGDNDKPQYMVSVATFSMTLNFMVSFEQYESLQPRVGEGFRVQAEIHSSAKGVIKLKNPQFTPLTSSAQKTAA